MDRIGWLKQCVPWSDGIWWNEMSGGQFTWQPFQHENQVAISSITIWSSKEAALYRVIDALFTPRFPLELLSCKAFIPS
jgi:hypothetical protein